MKQMPAMKSLILATAIRYLLPLMLLFSIFVLLRGHNDPGGGFVGGLIASAAFALYAIAEGVDAARHLLRITPHTLIAMGLATAVLSAIVAPIISDKPFMTGLWSDITLPAIGKLGTPLFFDLGVFQVVVGVTLLIVFSLAAEE